MIRLVINEQVKDSEVHRWVTSQLIASNGQRRPEGGGIGMEPEGCISYCMYCGLHLRSRS